jgi:hypothetical protein
VEVRPPIQLLAAVPDPADRALVELDAAIDMVALGLARRVHVTGLAGLEAVAAVALSRAQAAGVAFALSRDGGPETLSAIVGPRIAAESRPG